jgi:myosin heavy subunit
VGRSEKRKEPFSFEEEVATIFVLSELERKDGRLNASKHEKNVYILKVGYPLLLIVKDNATYVFDGLNRTSYDWMHYETSQIENVVGDFESNFRIHELYVKFLGGYQNFHHTLNSKKLTYEGLIADNTLLNELGNYRSEATEVYDTQTSLILPVLKETDVTKVVDQIEALQTDFREKTEKIKQLPELISKTTNGYIEGFNFESKAIAEEVEAKIKAQREVINPKIEKLTQEHKKQIEKLEKNIDSEQNPLEKQKTRIKKTMKEREINIEHYSKQAKLQAQRGNKRSEDNLKIKVKREQQELDELQSQYKKIEKQLKKLTEQKTIETTKLKQEFDKKVRTERKPILILETLRDEKQEEYKQESKKLEELTKLTLEELDDYIAQQKKLLTTIEPLSLETDPKLKNNAIIYIPFYIAAYNKTNTNTKRYRVFPPAIANSLGFSSKLMGALRMAKIKNLLDERFKAVSTLGEKLQIETSTNPELETQMEELSQKNNILNMKTPLTNGLLLLKEEGWLSEADYQMLLATLNTEVTY